MKELNAYIDSIAYYLPKAKLKNEELSEVFPSWSPEKIYIKTGIMNRHVAGENELVSDMAYEAAMLLFEKEKIDPKQIDFILLCTQSPDYYLPTTACIVQDRIGATTSCGAVDINQGCSGFIYGLALGKSLINTNVASNVLLIMSEMYTKHINKCDKSTRTLFGDGAAAILLKGDSDAQRIGEFTLKTNGKGAGNLIKPAGGMKLPYTEDSFNDECDKFGNVRCKANLYMNGPKIYEFAMENIPVLVEEILEKNKLDISEIDYFVFHQANKFMLKKLQKKMGIPSEKFCINMGNIGNTVSASIPIALEMANCEGNIKKGDKILIAGFGVGYSWGGTVITW